MSELASAVADSSIFQGYASGTPSALAVKANSQLFVAVSNVVKVASLLAKNSAVKVLNLSSEEAFDVTQLVFNKSESLLAVVGKKHIVIVDTKAAPDFNGSSSSWEPMNVAVKNTASEIKSVLWHPASSTCSQLVVLTEKEILVYDVVYSFTNPLLTVQLVNYPQLAKKNISSVAFGSSKNFAGCMTLYLSTDGGEVFAIYPFIIPESHLKSTKASARAFVDEWNLHMETFREIVPPSVVLDPYRHIFSANEKFVGSFESQLNSPLHSELSDLDEVSLSCDIEGFKVNLHGPLATTGPNCHLASLESSGEFPLLAAAYKGENGTSHIKYLAQFLPLTLPFEFPDDLEAAPQKPKPSQSNKKEKAYTKPTRGFGYVLDSESDEEEVDHVYESQLKTYNESLSLSKAKEKIKTFVESSFLTLTELSSDDTGVSTHSSVKALNDHVLLVHGPSILLADTESAVKAILTSEADYEASYREIKSNVQKSTIASFKDDIEGTGDYLVAFQPGQPVLVKNYGAKTNKLHHKKQPEVKALPEKAQRQILTNRVLSADELKQITKGSGSKLPDVSKFDPKKVESLNLIHEVTSASSKQANTLTKFVLAFQRKLQIQLEELRLQLRELNDVYTSVGSEDKHSDNLKRVETLITRQKELMEKEQAVRASVLERFQSHVANQKLPLSAAEKNWFKELNSITKDLGDWEQSATSWKSTVASLKAKTQELESAEKQADDEKLSAALSELSLGSNFPRLTHALNHENKIIVSTKTRLESCLAKLNGALESC